MSETRGLGRGLSSLIGETPARPRDGLRKVPVGDLRPGRLQPRTVFNKAEIDSLADSIRQHGLVQPLVARPIPGEEPMLEIIAGERRWRAAQKARLHEVPVLVRELDDRQVLEIALIENLQRSDLGALEEAAAYQRLAGEFGLNQVQIANAVGRSRAHVANTVRLLELPAPVRALLEQGSLTAGHARALLGAPDAPELAREITAKGLSVRETERLVASGGGARGRGGRGNRKVAAAPTEGDADIRDLERRLAERTGLKVSIKSRGERGELVLAYSNLDQLEDVISRLEAPTRPRLVQN